MILADAAFRKPKRLRSPSAPFAILLNLERGSAGGQRSFPKRASPRRSSQSGWNQTRSPRDGLTRQIIQLRELLQRASRALRTTRKRAPERWTRGLDRSTHRRKVDADPPPSAFRSVAFLVTESRLEICNESRRLGSSGRFCKCVSHTRSASRKAACALIGSLSARAKNALSRTTHHPPAQDQISRRCGSTSVPLPGNRAHRKQVVRTCRKGDKAVGSKIWRQRPNAVRAALMSPFFSSTSANIIRKRFACCGTAMMACSIARSAAA